MLASGYPRKGSKGLSFEVASLASTNPQGHKAALQESMAFPFKWD